MYSMKLWPSEVDSFDPSEPTDPTDWAFDRNSSTDPHPQNPVSDSAFLSSTTATEFLRVHGFDFNDLIDSGTCHMCCLFSVFLSFS